jgi:hypothetical protein
VLATSADGRRFSYDASGNLLGDGAGRTLVWSATNELLAVGQAGADGSFEFLGYGPEGELVTRLEIDASATAARPTSCSSGSYERRPTCARVRWSGAS